MPVHFISQNIREREIIVMRRLWEYYSNIANKAGNETDKNGKAKPAAYSIAWFYNGYKLNQLEEKLNGLTQSFLGNEVAYTNLHCITDEQAEEAVQELGAHCTGTPNASQLRAIAHAMENNITIIQGPPGTGKTATIQNLLRCLMKRDNKPTVAVVSSNSEAINNILDLVKEDELLRGLYANLGRKKNRKAFAEAHRNESKLKDILEKCSDENEYKFPSELLEHYPIVFSTIHSLRKCIETDETFQGVFDYVIVDECSQVGSVLGILAMESAKHLVLLGDDEQLAPIHHESGRNFPIHINQEYYRDSDDNSFMRACRLHFGEKAANIFLNEHYRCHPAIIGFCNEYVYDGKLNVRSKEDEKMPIRIRWYEGDYWEQIPILKETDDITESDYIKEYNSNQKQIKVFMEDEYPYILQKMKENKDFSVCVLSPYRYPLEKLEEAIVAYNQSLQEHVANPKLEENEDPVEKIPQLTIHKAQGRGYDLVYILTVVDCGNNVWPQRKSLLNVAVSRAKKELCVITSATWMPGYMQKQLLGYSIPNTYKENERYVKKLIDYVIKETEKRDAEGYGMQRSSVHSVFDKVLYYRQKKNVSGIDEPQKEMISSAPEKCLLNALLKCDEVRENYDIYCEVPLESIEGITPRDKEQKEYIANGARFDIVIAKEQQVHLIIEVDGEYHRQDRETQERDRIKDEMVLSLGEDFAKERYIRLATDGTTCNEIDTILNMLYIQEDKELPKLSNTKNNWRYSGMHEQLVELLDDFMRSAADTLNEEINEEDNVISDELHSVMTNALNFANGHNPEAEYRNRLLNAYYMYRFGYAYAFEYAAIYEMLLKDYRALEQQENPILGVCSLGCGSAIDAWSLAYAKEKLAEEGNELARRLSLRYYGVDAIEWPMMIGREQNTVLNEIYPSRNPHYPGIGSNNPGDIVDFFREEKYYSLYNILFFPKILNELEDDTVENMLNEIDEAVSRGGFAVRDEIYLCISHSKTHLQRGLSVVSRIIERINRNDDFVVRGDIPEIWNEGRTEGHKIQLAETSRNTQNCPEERKCYEFVKNDEYAYVDSVDEYFERINEFERIFQNLKNAYKRRFEQENPNVEHRPEDFKRWLDNNGFNRYPVTRVSQICFQIIKLTRRGEGEEA